MQRITWLPVLAGLFLFSVLQSCKYKSDFQVPLDYNIYNNENRVTASFYGQVVDEAGAPVQGAQVSTGTQVTQTDSNGVFYFTQISVPEHNTTIRVAKADFLPGYRSMMVFAGATHEVRMTLLAKSQLQTFVSSAGGTIKFNDDLSVVFPAKAMVQASNGLPYEGSVYAYARTLDANSDAGKQQMPGDLRALRANMAEQAAYSYGMMHIALYDAAGNALALAPQIDAQIMSKVKTAQFTGAPAGLLLSHFDEAIGIWKERSMAVLQGVQYLGPIHDMGYYMVHTNDDAVQVDATILGANNSPLSGYVVKWVNKTRKDSRMVISNTDGRVRTLLPTNSDITMEVYSPNFSCGTNPLYTQDVKTDGLPIQLGTVIVGGSLVNYAGISGQVIDCSNEAVTNGFLFSSPLNVFIPVNSAGNFAYTFPCAPAVPVRFYAYNKTNKQYTLSPAFSLSSGMNNPIGNLFACDNITPFIDIVITNTVTMATANRSFTAPVDTVRSSVDLINGGSILSAFNGSNFMNIVVADSVEGNNVVSSAGFNGIGNFPDNQFAFVSGDVTYTSFPFFPGHALGQFTIYFTGLPSGNSYIATGTFRMPRVN